MYQANITLSQKTGRNIAGNDHGNLTHARINGSWVAICGAKPGKHSDWSAYEKTLTYQEAITHASLITCPRCNKGLYKLSEKPHFGCGSVRD